MMSPKNRDTKLWCVAVNQLEMVKVGLLRP
jgi:hypothetical protein